MSLLLRALRGRGQHVKKRKPPTAAGSSLLLFAGWLRATGQQHHGVKQARRALQTTKRYNDGLV